MIKEELLQTINGYYKNTDDNIIGVGYGYKTVNGLLIDEKSIVFTVKEKLSLENIKPEQLLPKTINISNEIISTDVVQNNFMLMCDPSFYLWQNTTGYTVPNTESIRPLRGGISTSNYSQREILGPATLGFLAKDNETNSLVGVTNNHVYVRDAFICSTRNINNITTNIKNEITAQPGGDNSILSESIGVIKRYYPITDQSDNDIDIALTTIDQSVIDSNSYYQLGLSANTYQFATTSEIDNLLITNPDLYSSGDRTGAKGEGITKLKAISLGNSFMINYNKQNFQNSTVSFRNAIGFVATLNSSPPYSSCQYPIWHGDSGSALLANISGQIKIVGLCFAADQQGVYPNYYSTIGYACRIDFISTLMNISPWNGELINFSNTSNIQEITINGKSNQKYVDFGGNRYWQAGLRFKHEPITTTTIPIVIDTTTVNAGGFVNYCEQQVTELGVCLDINPNPNQYTTVLVQLTGQTIGLSGLAWSSNLDYIFTPGITYYLRAYTLYLGNYFFGDIITVDTSII
jgi:hypothetical protein